LTLGAIQAAEAAKQAVNAIANPTMPEVGERYLGTVVKTTTFGAFVSLLPGKDGLLHISQIRKLAGGKRVENVEDVVGVGQKVQVEIAEIDSRGKLSLIPVIEGEEGDESRDGLDRAAEKAVPERRPQGSRLRVHGEGDEEALRDVLEGHREGDRVSLGAQAVRVADPRRESFRGVVDRERGEDEERGTGVQGDPIAHEGHG